MNTTVKICGLSTPEAVLAARDGGATHLGFIFFEPSPRNVTPVLAAKFARDRRDARAVAVSVNAADEFLENIVTTLRPDMLQLHGIETPQRVEQLKVRYGLPVIKAMTVHTAADIETARLYDGIADVILLDARPPKGSVLPGGNGISFDWSLIDTLQMQSPVLLSGGIDVDNLPVALNRVTDPGNSLAGIDVSSGIECAPGVKDLSRIAAFMKICRENEMQAV